MTGLEPFIPVLISVVRALLAQGDTTAAQDEQRRQNIAGNRATRADLLAEADALNAPQDNAAVAQVQQAIAADPDAVRAALEALSRAVGNDPAVGAEPIDFGTTLEAPIVERDDA